MTEQELVYQKIDKFHAHLDICNQCRNHPFGLCSTGAGLLKDAATSSPGYREEDIMGMVDMTGKPRSDEELQEAIDCIKTIMVKHSTVLPLLTVHAGTIKNCLEELQERRRKEKE